VNDIDTIKCTKHLISNQLILAIISSILIASCASFTQNSERPSPFSSDSISLSYSLLTIEYSSPKVKGREIWGSKIVPYDKVWRTGANEATVFTTSDSILLGGSLLVPGKYAIFTKPSGTEWTVMFNSEWSQWGSYGYDKKLDVVTFSVKPDLNEVLQEEMTFKFNSDTLYFAWEFLSFSIPISQPN